MQLLTFTEKRLRDNTIFGYSQKRFMKRKSCLTNLISFPDKVTHLIDKGKPEVLFYFSKAFDTVSCSIFLDKRSIQLKEENG